MWESPRWRYSLTIMLLLPRNWASKTLNPQFCGAFCSGGTSLVLVVSTVTVEGINVGVRYESDAWLLRSSKSRAPPPPQVGLILMCWPWLLLWRRCCLAARRPWEPSLVLFPLFFLPLFTAVLLRRWRFLRRKVQHIQVLFGVNGLFLSLSRIVTSEGKCVAWSRLMPLPHTAPVLLTRSGQRLFPEAAAHTSKASWWNREVVLKRWQRIHRHAHRRSTLQLVTTHSPRNRPYPLTLSSLLGLQLLTRTHWSHVRDSGSADPTRERGWTC